MIRILFVCLGNICRSPLAEALFRKHVIDHNLVQSFSCDSCGTAGYHIGSHPDSRSRGNAERNGLDFDHRARQISSDDFNNFDYIIAMDKSNLRVLENMESEQQKHIHLMLDFDEECKGEDVPDPYYDGEDGFQKVFEMLDRSTAALLNHLTT